MPIYRVKDTETQEITEHFVSYDEVRKMVDESEGRLSIVIGAPKIVSGVGTNLKVTDSFKEAVAKVKETHTINNIPDY